MYFEILFIGFNGIQQGLQFPTRLLSHRQLQVQTSCFLKMSSKLFLFCSVGIKQKALVLLCLSNLDGGIDWMTSNLGKASIELMVP